MNKWLSSSPWSQAITLPSAQVTSLAIGHWLSGCFDTCRSLAGAGRVESLYGLVGKFAGNPHISWGNPWFSLVFFNQNALFLVGMMIPNEIYISIFFHIVSVFGLTLPSTAAHWTHADTGSQDWATARLHQLLLQHEGRALVGCAEAFWGDGEIEVGVMSSDLESQWIGLRLRMIRMLRANRSTGNHGFSSQTKTICLSRLCFHNKTAGFYGHVSW